MSQLRSFITQYWWAIAIGIFVIARVYIFLNPPVYVRYFEEYANIWYYGMPPYLKHWFEYPPATIPFISLPLYLDLAGIGKYRLDFRVMMLIFDVALFALVLKTMSKLQYSSPVKLLNAVFYIVLTAKSKDFMYENLDLLFALSVFIPATVPLFMKKGKEFTQWLLFWFGTGIKLVNAPLALLYFFDSDQPWEKRLTMPFITFLLIWAAPLAIFRSSLLVIWAYHKNRTLQVESIPALIVRGLNIFTKTEHIFFSQYKSFDLAGPISDKVLILSNVALVVSMLALVWYIWKNRSQATHPIFIIKVTLIFIFSYLATNKVFSTPYHLWYLCLVAVYPYKNWRERLMFFTAATVFAGVATTHIPDMMIGPGALSTWIPVLTQIPACLVLLFASYYLTVPTNDTQAPVSVASTSPQKLTRSSTRKPTPKPIAKPQSASSPSQSRKSKSKSAARKRK